MYFISAFAVAAFQALTEHLSYPEVPHANETLNRTSIDVEWHQNIDIQ